MSKGKLEFIDSPPNESEMGEEKTLYVDPLCNFYIFKNPNFISKSKLCFIKYFITEQEIYTNKNVFIFDKESDINYKKSLNCEIINENGIFKIKSDFYTTFWKISFNSGEIIYEDSVDVTIFLFNIYKKDKKLIYESRININNEELSLGYFETFIEADNLNTFQIEVINNKDESCKLKNSYVIFEQLV